MLNRHSSDITIRLERMCNAFRLLFKSFRHRSTEPFDRIQRRGMENPPITRDEVEGWAHCMQPPSEEEMSLFDRALTLDQ